MTLDEALALWQADIDAQERNASEAGVDEPSPELDRRRAALATIRAALADRDQLAAEVESYRTQFAELAVDLDTTVKEKQRMWAEITRLRAALLDANGGG
jgi:chromosome segregation ATPase